ncbi:hypothetical protein G6F59_014752 [Rhizopus arrhizus]|nr:hypothetical protein G6F59_014752 [Rhizopus arrhizus]
MPARYIGQRADAPAQAFIGHQLLQERHVRLAVLHAIAPAPAVDGSSTSNVPGPMRQRRVHREHRADDAGHVLILEHATVAAVMQPGGPVGQVHAVPHEAACAGQALDTADQPDPDNVCTVRQACGDACRPGHPIIQAVLARLAQQIDLAAQAFGQRFAAVPTLHDQPQCATNDDR